MGKPPQPIPGDGDELPPPSYEQAIIQPSSSAASNSYYQSPILASPIPSEQPYLSINANTRASNQVTLDADLSADPSALHALVARQADVPARPVLTIRGTHTVTRSENHGRKHRSRNVTDFDFKVDLSPYVVGSGPQGDRDEDGWHELKVVGDGDGVKRYRGGVFPSRRWKGHGCCGKKKKRGAIRLSGQGDGDDENVGLVRGSEEGRGDVEEGLGRGSPGLIGWCDRFCEDPAPVKSFTFERSVSGLDSDIIRSALKSHLRALNYRGKVEVSTAIANRSFTVYSPHWINRARNNPWIFYGCLLLQLWILTWPVLWLLERKYRVVESEWRFSRPSGANNKTFAQGRSEAEVAKDVAPVVTQAAWERRRAGNILTAEEVDTLRRLELEGRQRGGRVMVVNFGDMGEWGNNHHSFAG
ncbi:hypothetical protein N8T08_002699 [Aspergillus melleus]|uniref:Uncharacterized protein n=1 Tax=Aspergillus melleus TaxID=138277 RepID=A0ACC3B8E8_9EURO|nr:hypothetical protein N8T08_002699 [Aspergillus melleus]